MPESFPLLLILCDPLLALRGCTWSSRLVVLYSVQDSLSRAYNYKFDGSVLELFIVNKDSLRIYSKQLHPVQGQSAYHDVSGWEWGMMRTEFGVQMYLVSLFKIYEEPGTATSSHPVWNCE